jgi:peptide/nickel transport system ATP-binding protein
MSVLTGPTVAGAPESPGIAREPVLEARQLTKTYRMGAPRRGANPRGVCVVEGVDLALYEGRTLALVGESGCGKTTCARMLAQLVRPTSGQVLLRGRPVSVRSGRQRRRYVSDVQLLLQDPFASLNPVHSIRYQLTRVLRLHGHATGARAVEHHLESLLAKVQLSPAPHFLDKYPHELSGGQLQRVAIARALAARPRVLLLDEPVSMLDVSIRLGVLNLLATLKDEEQLAVLYITHDIASARYFAEDMLVMYRGHLVERGPSDVVTQQPAHPYTRLLIASAPDPERRAQAGLARPSGPRTHPMSDAGCPFAHRCPYVTDICRTEIPPLFPVSAAHSSRCWLARGDSDGPEPDRTLSSGANR